MEITANQLKLLGQAWSKEAGEELTIEHLSGCVYAYGSEIATLRLLKYYAGSMDRAKHDFSKNLGTFFFRLDINVEC